MTIYCIVVRYIIRCHIPAFFRDGFSFLTYESSSSAKEKQCRKGPDFDMGVPLVTLVHAGGMPTLDTRSARYLRVRSRIVILILSPRLTQGTSQVSIIRQPSPVSFRSSTSS